MKSTIKSVSREQYSRVICSLPAEWAEPIHTTTIGLSAMQYINPFSGRLVAQAIYWRGSKPIYQVRIADIVEA